VRRPENFTAASSSSSSSSNEAIPAVLKNLFPDIAY